MKKSANSPNQLRSYLGRLLYFRQHVLGFSHYSARLHEAATRPPKNWRLTPDELADFFMLKKAFLSSTAIGYLDVENLDKNRLKVFVDWSSLGLSAVVTQTQNFSENGQSVEKEVLIGSISRKCPHSCSPLVSSRTLSLIFLGGEGASPAGDHAHGGKLGGRHLQHSLCPAPARGECAPHPHHPTPRLLADEQLLPQGR